MGRGEQMSDVSISSSGKDLWGVVSKRKVVAMVAIFLSLVITSSYMFITTSDPSTETMMLFQGRPFSSLLPLSGGENVSTIDGAANGIDTEGGPDFEEPVQENIAPVAEEEEEAKTLDSNVTPTFINETSPPPLGFPDQELANVSTADLLKKNLTSTFPIANTTTTASNNSSNHQQSNLETEGQGLSNTTTSTTTKSKGTCNLLEGRWMPDPRPPQYTNATCNHIHGDQNCLSNGRPDTGYLYWKWQPEQCDLPRVDHQAFLTAMRNRSMAFVGDSIARNQFQSLLCLLSETDQPKVTDVSADYKDQVFVFPSYNFTLAVYWSPYLMHVEKREITLPNNTTDSALDIHIDKLDEALVGRMSGVDILQISTGQWWFKFAYYFQKGRNIGCHTWPGMPECEDLGFAETYHTGLQNVLQSILSVPGFTGTAVLRTFSPDHFEDGSWSTDGHCLRTGPGGVPMHFLTKSMYAVQLQVFQNVTGALTSSERRRLRLLDITALSQERPDGHPDAYRVPHPFSDNAQRHRVQRDCLHWCLPGPIDTWNQLLMESLRDVLHT